MKRRHEAEEEAGRERDEKGEGQHAPVECRLGEPRRPGGGERLEPRQEPLCQAQAGHTPENGQEQAFHEQAGGEPPAGRAEGHAHRQLPAATERPDDLEVRHVEAGDREHGSDRAQEEKQRAPHVLHDVVVEGGDLGPHLMVRVRERCREALRDGMDLRSRLPESCAGSQPRHDLRLVVAPVCEKLGREGRRQEERHGAKGAEPARRDEPRRKHTHHAARLPIETDRPAENARVRREPAPPEGVREDHDTLAALPVFLGDEGPAQHRPHAEHGEEVGRDGLPEQRSPAGPRR